MFAKKNNIKCSPKIYNLSTVELAKRLLGTHLVFGNMRGKIVETEAYLFRDDPGCHAHRGKTLRNAPMFKSAGRTYVYFIYGMYYCLNVVSGKVGEGEAVLIRALEPLCGIDEMMMRRKTHIVKNLCNGPGKLTQAFGITKAHNDLDLTNAGELCIYDRCDDDPFEIVTTTRIGLSAGADLPLRFYIANNKYVSKIIK